GRTVWLAPIDPTVIAHDVQRPVSLADALSFRNLTVWIAFVPIALAASVWFIFLWGRFTGWSSNLTNPAAPAVAKLAWVLDWLFLPVVLLALFLFLKAIAGVQSYFFHPSWLPVVRQNRAVALSYYACAPLAWTPISLA